MRTREAPPIFAKMPVGIHTLGGVREIEIGIDRRTIVHLLRIDDETLIPISPVHAIRLADQDLRLPAPPWPLSLDRVAETAVKMADQSNDQPRVCHFFYWPSRPNPIAEHLYAVDEHNGLVILDVSYRDDTCLPLSTYQKVPPGRTRSLCIRPQFSFYANRIVASHANDFVVHGFRIGTKEPLRHLTPERLLTTTPLPMELITSGIDVTMEVSYVGDDPQGERFDAGIIGTAVGTVGAPKGAAAAVHWTPAGRQGPWT